MGAATPVGVSFDSMGATPVGNFANIQTPTPGQLQFVTPEQMHAMRWEQDVGERNRPLSDEDLDKLMPSEGYTILEPPASYKPIRTPARKIAWTPTPLTGDGGFMMAEDDPSSTHGAIDLEQPSGNLPAIKPEDKPYFEALLQDVNEEELSVEEQKERKIMKLLLKIKNGTPPMRKQALRQITDKAREFAPALSSTRSCLSSCRPRSKIRSVTCWSRSSTASSTSSTTSSDRSYTTSWSSSSPSSSTRTTTHASRVAKSFPISARPPVWPP